MVEYNSEKNEEIEIYGFFLLLLRVNQTQNNDMSRSNMRSKRDWR